MRRKAEDRVISQLAEDLRSVIVLTSRFDDDDYERIAGKLYSLGWRNIRQPGPPLRIEPYVSTEPPYPATYGS